MLPISSSEPSAINTFAQLRYSKRAPIFIVDSEQAMTFTEKLDQNINDWCLSPEEKDATAYQAAWNERINTSHHLLNNQKIYFFSGLYASEQIRFYVYKINDETPAGMMITSCFYEGYLTIERLVTHPGSMGCGGALIEEAVRYSKMQGYHGVVKLIAVDDKAALCYLALGFKEEKEEEEDEVLLLKLDPNTNEHWEKNKENDNKWSLKKYITTFCLENVFKEVAG